MKKILIFIIFCMFAYGAQADEQLTTIINELKTLNKDLKTLEKAVLRALHPAIFQLLWKELLQDNL